MACYGLDMIDKRSRQMFELTMVVRENVVIIPKAIWLQCSQLMASNGFYERLDKFLSELESKLQYWMPLPEQHRKDEKAKTSVDLLLAFMKQLNEHLKHYAKGNFFIIQLMSIIDRFKHGLIIMPSPLAGDKVADKPDVPNSVMNKMVEMISSNDLSKSAIDQQQKSVERKQQKEELEQFKDQVTAVVDQIISS
ncbi:hypothetical protein BLA29_010384, partial [Euroglyphus maynei]